jgi:hypothetical protein
MICNKIVSRGPNKIICQCRQLFALRLFQADQVLGTLPMLSSEPMISFRFFITNGLVIPDVTTVA